MSLVREEVDHFRAGGSGITLVGRPEVVLTPKAALALSLALHELVTNAGTYGALSVKGGRLVISWHLAMETGLTLAWREAGGPAVRPPERAGFGTMLIERALRMETGGQSLVRFEPGGVECDIVLPLSAVVRCDDEAPPPVAETPPAVAAKARTRCGPAGRQPRWRNELGRRPVGRPRCAPYLHQRL